MRPDIQRDLVGKLGVSEPLDALEIARSISGPWYRCQALAQVAWNVEDGKLFKKVIEEASTVVRVAVKRLELTS